MAVSNYRMTFTEKEMSVVQDALDLISEAYDEVNTDKRWAKTEIPREDFGDLAVRIAERLAW